MIKKNVLKKSYTRLAALDSVKWSLGLSIGYFFSPIVFVLLTGSEISGNYLARQLINAIAMFPFIFVIIFICKFFSYKSEFKEIIGQSKNDGNDQKMNKGNDNILDIIKKIEQDEIAEIEEKEKSLSMRKKIILGIAVIVILFLIFVWPTQYRYENATLNGDKYLVRINRFTSSVDKLTPIGWLEMRPYHYEGPPAPVPDIKAPEPVPAPAATAAPSAMVAPEEHTKEKHAIKQESIAEEAPEPTPAPAILLHPSQIEAPEPQ